MSVEPVADTTRRFVLVANGEYVDLRPLERAAADGGQVAELFERHGLARHSVINQERGDLHDLVDEHLARGDLKGGTLVLLWIGHGVIETGGLRLMGKGKRGDVQVADARDLADWAGRTGARQILVLVDVCASGAGIGDAAAVANDIIEERPDQADTWISVVASCLSDESARSGALPTELIRLLTAGPRLERNRMAFNRMSPWLHGDDVVEALITEWSEPRQAPRPVRFGTSGPLIRNPFYEATVTGQVAEHLLNNASDVVDVELFTGREHTLRELAAQIRADVPGVVIVTGPAGSGKSAIVDRVIRLADAIERDRLMRREGIDQIDPELDPGIGSVTARLVGQGVTLESAIDGLADRLGLPAGASKYAVLDALHGRRLERSTPVIVLDGLDEAGSADEVVALGADLIGPLANEALVIVASRPIARDERDVLLGLGEVHHVIDLADRADTVTDVRTYIRRRLDGIDSRMDADAVADAFIEANDDARHGGLFLIARLVTSQLIAAPVDTSVSGWDASVGVSAEQVLKNDLDTTVLTVGGEPRPTAARELLTALSVAQGDGLPIDRWVALASAISKSGALYTRADVYSVLVELGRHVTASPGDDETWYRLAHRQLRDELMPAKGSEESRLVVDVLERLYGEHLDGGGGPRDARYLWRYFWVHCARAGEHGVAALRRLVELDDVFELDLALALAQVPVADRAIEDLTEAADTFRRLDKTNSLRWTLLDLSHRQSVARVDGAIDAALEAAELFRDDDDDAALAGGSLALTSACLAQRLDGNNSAAKRLADEAVKLIEGRDDLSEPERRALSAAYVQRSVLRFASDPPNGLLDARRAVEFFDDEPVEDRHVLAARVDAMLALAVLLSMNKQQQECLETLRSLIALVEHADDPGWSSMLHCAAAHQLVFEQRSNPESLEQADGWLRRVPAEITQGVIQRGALWTSRARHRAADDERLRRDLGELDPAIAAIDGSVHARIVLAGMRTVQLQTLETDPARRQELIASVLELLDGSQEFLGPGMLMHAIGLSFQLNGRITDDSSAARARLLDDYARRTELTIEETSTFCTLAIDEVGLLHQSGRLAEGRRLGSRALEVLAAHAHELDNARLHLGLLELNTGLCHIGAGNDAASTAVGRRICVQACWNLRPAAQNGTVSAWYALALNSMCALSLVRKRFDLAHAYARRAEAARRVAVNAELAPNLETMILLNDAHALVGLGLAAEATPKIDRAVSILRRVPVIDRPTLALLAVALGKSDDVVWREVLDQFADDAEVQGLLEAQRQVGDIVDHVDHLTDVIHRFADRASVVVAARNVARLRRTENPAVFDDAWSRHGELPSWLAVSDEFVDRMIELFNMDEWSVRRDLILDDPTLLSHEADIVLEELALHPHLTERADQLGRVIVDIRESGVEDALAAVLTIEEYHEWQRSDYDADVFAGLEPRWRATATTGRLRTDAPEYHALINGVLTLSARGELELASRILRGEMGRRVEHVLEVAVDAPDADRLDAISVLVYQSSEGGGALEAAALTARAVASVWSAKPERAAGFVADSTFEDPAHRAVAVAMCKRARDTVPARSDGIDQLLVALRPT